MFLFIAEGFINSPPSFLSSFLQVGPNPQHKEAIAGQLSIVASLHNAIALASQTFLDNAKILSVCRVIIPFAGGFRRERRPWGIQLWAGDSSNLLETEHVRPLNPATSCFCDLEC